MLVLNKVALFGVVVVCLGVALLLGFVTHGTVRPTDVFSGVLGGLMIGLAANAISGFMNEKLASRPHADNTNQSGRTATGAEVPSRADWREFAQDQRARMQGMAPFLLLEGESSTPIRGARPEISVVDDPRLIDLPVAEQENSPKESLIRRLQKCLGRSKGKRRSTRSRGRPLELSLRQRRAFRGEARYWMLLGQAGSGKSVTLQRFVHNKLEKAVKSGWSHRTIPLYVRLSDLDRLTSDRPTPEEIGLRILELAATSGAKNLDPSLHQRLRRWLAWGCRKGRWLLILDGFDEIPALAVGADVPSPAAHLANAIYDFVRQHRLPTLLSSRPFPLYERYEDFAQAQHRRSSEHRVAVTKRHLPWPILNMCPLGPAEQAAVLKRWFPRWFWGRPSRRMVLADLRAQEHVFGGFLQNPLYLAAICLFVSDNRELPRSAQVAFGHFVTRRLHASTVINANEGQSLSVDALRACAGRIGIVLINGQIREVGNAQGGLSGALFDSGWPQSIDPDEVMHQLQRQRLGRREGAGRPGQQRFLFLHQRILEHFAVAAIVENPEIVDPQSLLSEARWRNVAAGVLQSGTQDQLEPLFDVIRRTTRRWAEDLTVSATVSTAESAERPQELAAAALAERARTTGFQWPAGSLHLLGILESAAEGRADKDPETGRHVDRILAEAVRHGSDAQKAEAMRVARAGSDEHGLRVLAEGLDSNRSFLRDIAYEQALDLGRVSPGSAASLLPSMRKVMVARWATNTPDAGGVRVLLRRLDGFDPSGSLRKGMRLLRLMPRIDAGIFLTVPVIAITFLMSSAEDQTFAGFQGPTANSLLWFWFIFLVYWPALYWGASNVSKTRKGHDLFCRMATASQCFWARLLRPIIFGRIALLLWLAFFVWLHVIDWSFTGEDGTVTRVDESWLHLISIVAAQSILWIFWGVFSILAAAHGRFVDPIKWMFWPVLPVVIMLKEKKSTRAEEPSGFRAILNTIWFNFKQYFAAVGVLSSILLLGDGDLRDSSTLFDWLSMLPLIIMALWLATAELLDRLKVIWLRCRPGCVRIDRLLWVASQRFPIYRNRARLRLLNWALYDADLCARPESERWLGEAIEAIQIDTQRRLAADRRMRPLQRLRVRLPWADRSGWRPSDDWSLEIRQWYDRYARPGKGVADLCDLVGPLISLRERIIRELEYDDQRQ
jgi:hypothetical protein